MKIRTSSMSFWFTGGNTAGDRKGALIEATGPQQGVIRNRW